jgi:hypothetical protein
MAELAFRNFGDWRGRTVGLELTGGPLGSGSSLLVLDPGEFVICPRVLPQSAIERRMLNRPRSSGSPSLEFTWPTKTQLPKCHGFLLKRAAGDCASYLLSFFPPTLS